MNSIPAKNLQRAIRRTRKLGIKMPAGNRAYTAESEQHVLWALRILVDFHLIETLLADDNKNYAERLVKMIPFKGTQALGANPDEAQLHLHAQKALAAWEKSAPTNRPQNLLAGNVARLAAHLALSPLEHEMLYFMLSANRSRFLHHVLRYISTLNVENLPEFFAATLACDTDDARRALLPQANLHGCGLLRIDGSETGTLECVVNVIGDLAARCHEPFDDVMTLFAERIAPPPPVTLGCDDYPHLSQHIAALKALLGTAKEQSTCGVNVLLYGPPGTGKTELAGVLAASLGHTLYEIASRPPRGNPYTPEERLRALRLAQPLLARHRSAVLLFDEIEDVFSGETVFSRGHAAQHKGYFNRQLETNAVPTLWISNDISTLDPAFIRRFDYVLAVETPPLAIRQGIVAQAFAGLPVTENWRRQVALHRDISPAVITRTARTAHALLDNLPKENIEGAMANILKEHLRATGGEALPVRDANSELRYRPELLHVDGDLDALARALAATPQGRLCFHGASGTGKSALARHLAECCGKPLHERRVSDLVSPYVGRTERNLADAFRHATRDNAVLLFDEADSFLRERRLAQHGWEISAVNEMLTQMEAFNGLFIATTNLVETLDAASLRRFDIKLRFDFLKPGQARELFGECCEKLGFADAASGHAGHGAAGSGIVSLALARLTTLTPGDFATVMRRARLQPLRDAHALLTALEQECRLKPDQPKRGMGFMAG